LIIPRIVTTDMFWPLIGQVPSGPLLHIIPQNHTPDNNFQLLIFLPITVLPFNQPKAYDFNCGMLLTH